MKVTQKERVREMLKSTMRHSKMSVLLCYRDSFQQRKRILATYKQTKLLFLLEELFYFYFFANDVKEQFFELFISY